MIFGILFHVNDWFLILSWLWKYLFSSWYIYLYVLANAPLDCSSVKKLVLLSHSLSYHSLDLFPNGKKFPPIPTLLNDATPHSPWKGIMPSNLLIVYHCLYLFLLIPSLLMFLKHFCFRHSTGYFHIYFLIFYLKNIHLSANFRLSLFPPLFISFHRIWMYKR